jgi:hypothetical protein
LEKSRGARAKVALGDQAPRKPQAATMVAPYSGNSISLPPQGGDRAIFRIAEHRAAVAAYDRCVDDECDAEGKIHDEDFARLEAATKQAFDQMMFAARCLIIDVPTTRTGLIRWTTYLRKLLIDGNACDSGSPYLPNKINGKPWVDTLLAALSSRLRKMGDEFPADKRSRRSRRPQQ